MSPGSCIAVHIAWSTRFGSGTGTQQTRQSSPTVAWNNEMGRNEQRGLIKGRESQQGTWNDGEGCKESQLNGRTCMSGGWTVLKSGGRLSMYCAVLDCCEFKSLALERGCRDLETKMHAVFFRWVNLQQSKREATDQRDWGSWGWCSARAGVGEFDGWVWHGSSSRPGLFDLRTLLLGADRLSGQGQLRKYNKDNDMMMQLDSGGGLL